MAEIKVEDRGGGTYRVDVQEGGSSSQHQVTVSADELARYGGGAEGAELVEASFRFLLAREPKESILGRFELSVIERYFPEYPKEIRRVLAG
jgi:hypothetical protein